MNEVTRREAVRLAALAAAVVVGVDAAAKTDVSGQGAKGSTKGIRSLAKKRLLTEPLTKEEMRATQGDLQVLSEDVHKVMVAYGLAGPKSGTVCRAVAIIGPDGEPRTVIQCETAQYGKCKRPGCKCPGYEGGYKCTNCGHSDVDHI